METSCRKKYKPSPKKWILASSYPEFRRNSALIPANAGLFHYAGNNPVRYIDPDGKTQVYFLYTYNSNDSEDQQMLQDEWSSINDDIKFLRENGISVEVDLAATKKDINQAFLDPEATVIVTSGHGIKAGKIMTSDGLTFSPDDIPVINRSSKLKAVILENCYQRGKNWFSNKNEVKWKKKLDEDTLFIGWKGCTNIYETKNFNGHGYFDRQKLNLRQILEKVFSLNKEESE